MKSFIVTTGFVLLLTAAHAQKRLTAVTSSRGTLIEHTVTSGESLNYLSKKYDVSLAALAKANGMKASEGLKIGETIKVPITRSNLTDSKRNNIPVYYEAGAKDNLSTISRKFNGVPVKTLRSWNKMKKDVVARGQKLLVGYMVSNGVEKDAADGGAEKSSTKKQRSAESRDGKQIKVGTAINIRKGPGTDKPVLSRVAKDETVTVLKQVNDEWSSVRTADGKTGYAATQYLVSSSSENNEEPAKANGKDIKLGTALNIRKGPGTDKAIVAKAQQDETITVLRQVNKEWSSVRTSDGVEGYAASQYLEPVSNKEQPVKEEGKKIQLTTALNIRKGPGTDKPMVTTAENGATLTVLKKVNDEWSAVRTSDGIEGYAATKYLEPGTETTVVASNDRSTKTKEEQAKVNVETTINIRKGPGTDQPVVGSAQKDEIVTVTRHVNKEWAAIRTNGGVEGFMATQFLGPLDATAPVATSKAVAVTKKPEQQKRPAEQEPVSSAPVADVATNATDDQSGFFKAAYMDQNSGAATNDKSVHAGIFKTDKGWADGKYYALIDGIPAGTIVKLANPGTNAIVYAKVLGDVKSLKTKDNLDARISEAAATALRINAADFDLKVTHYRHINCILSGGKTVEMKCTIRKRVAI